MRLSDTRRALLAPLLILLLAVFPACATVQPSEPATEVAPEEVTLTPATFDDPELVQHYQELIRADEMAAHLYFLASDYFQGRETLTQGQHKTAEYLASQYRLMNVEPMGTAEVDDPRAPENYYQPFPLYGHQLVSSTLEVYQSESLVTSSTFSLDSPDGHSFVGFGNVAESEGGVVFAGYGISDEELGYSDYYALDDADISTDGRWMIILRDEPMDDDGQSLLTDDGTPSRWTETLNDKLRFAFAYGPPAGILVVADSGPTGIDVGERARTLAEFEPPGGMSLEPHERQEMAPPIYMVSTEFADQILEYQEASVEALREQINSTTEPVVFEIPNVRVASTLDFEAYERESENVLGFVNGSDPDLRDEVIVITSHYDHIGLSPTAGENYVNNGADDNASGTVGTLALANAFQRAAEDGYGPRRSILFMNVSAEEKGLLGSAYYTDINPVFPLENTVLNINMDMIGRIDPTYEGPDENYVYIIGADLISEDLHEANVRANEITGIDLTLSYRYNDPGDPQQLYRRSDQWNFGKHDIPFIFYFTGLHEDYHDVGDEAWKIEYERMEKIVRLAFATVWQVANQDERPQVTGEGFN